MPATRRDRRARRRMKVVVADTTSFTVDVSQGGFSTETMRVLPVGTHVKGTLYVGDRQVPFAGRVAWSRAGSVQLNIRGRMGIAFTAPPDLDTDSGSR